MNDVQDSLLLISLKWSPINCKFCLRVDFITFRVILAHLLGLGWQVEFLHVFNFAMLC